jgi:hypothetical protein
MTKDEALKLALEALEDLGMKHYESTGEVLYKETFTAIKTALEAKDEPVSQPKVRTGNCLRVGVCASEGHKIQPQRTWIGLTDEEVDQAFTELTLRKIYQAIEAKLKEKNYD